MNANLKIAIAETSSIIRSGVELQLKKSSGFRCQFVEIAESELLIDSINKHQPDILIINPLMLTGHSLQQVKEESHCPTMKCVALLHTLVDKSLLRPYDEQISLYDSADELKQKLEQLCVDEAPEEAEAEEQQVLSTREKEIVVCVVKGMTNREIADSLFLSTHTVITHRRNIARKLQIHSASGLTVYAIVNKLVELSDINP